MIENVFRLYWSVRKSCCFYSPRKAEQVARAPRHILSSRYGAAWGKMDNLTACIFSHPILYLTFAQTARLMPSPHEI